VGRETGPLPGIVVEGGEPPGQRQGIGLGETVAQGHRLQGLARDVQVADGSRAGQLDAQRGGVAYQHLVGGRLQEGFQKRARAVCLSG
jgi:hypothetical protein